MPDHCCHQFTVAFDLARRGLNFAFFEMDVHFVGSAAASFFQQALGRDTSWKESDVVVSSHQYSPQEPNIGVFAVRGSQASSLMFKQTLRWTAADPNLHDQRAFCLVANLCKNRQNNQSPVNYPLPETTKIKVTLLHTSAISASVTPRIIPGETWAVHPLSTSPLMSPMAKTYVVKEMMAFHGSRSYFPHRCNDLRGAGSGVRLLAFESTLSLSRNRGYHCTSCRIPNLVLSCLLTLWVPNRPVPDASPPCSSTSTCSPCSS